MSDFADIQLFESIVRHGNMAAAAHALEVTPPVITRRLAALEKRLGVRLLQRTTRRLRLTPEGELYLLEGTRLLEALHGLEHQIGSATRQAQGTVKLAASFGFGRTWIAPLLSDFVRRYPKVDVQLHLTDRPVNLVEQGQDLLVQFGPVATGGLIARPLAHNRRLLCAAPDYLRRNSPITHPRDLGQHNCIFIRQGTETFGTWAMMQGKHRESVKVRANLSCNDGSAALQWALDGLGLLMRSEWEVAGHLREGRLQEVLADWQLAPADIHLVYHPKDQMTAKTRALIDYLLLRFEPYRQGRMGSRPSSAPNPW